ncbi:hypothetical protein GBA52_015303 [Prunus armeniaca]|nr:hypothetical protein GBA52_015303 [Prunus armeniaca]
MHQNAGAAPNAGGCFLLMIHKKGGRIRTYGRPAPDLLGWVAGLAPLVASVPKTDALRYPAPLGLLSRQGECAFALFLRPVMLFPARHALTLSTAFLVSRPVAAAASVKARSERDICGAVPVPLWRDLRQLRSAELPSTQPCKTRFRIPLILKLVWLFGAPRGKLCG